MTDPYLAISAIANDQYMTERMNAAATQQEYLTNLLMQDPLAWVAQNRYVWASSPTWGEKWRYALDSHTDDPEYQPGKDEAVITDGDILSTVQHLASTPAPPAQAQIDAEAPEGAREDATAGNVQQENHEAMEGV